jgi:hypothetical protein
MSLPYSLVPSTTSDGDDIMSSNTSHRYSSYTLTDDELAKLETLVMVSRLPGMTINKEFRRAYKLDPPTSVQQANARLAKFECGAEYRERMRLPLLAELGLAMPVSEQLEPMCHSLI